ncbi:MAG: hypothetical protein ACLQPD_17425, partial [Desulfomonilaceae bacterium]
MKRLYTINGVCLVLYFHTVNTNYGTISEMICETILNDSRYTDIYRRAGVLSSREPTKEGQLQLLHRAARWWGVWLKSGELFIREPLGRSTCSRGR